MTFFYYWRFSLAESGVCNINLHAPNKVLNRRPSKFLSCQIVVKLKFHCILVFVCKKSYLFLDCDNLCTCWLQVWWATRAARAAFRLATTICFSAWWRARRCSTSRRATSRPASRARGGTRFSGPTCATPTSEWVVCLRLELITRRRHRRAQTLHSANLHYKWVSSWAPALCTRARWKYASPPA